MSEMRRYSYKVVTDAAGTGAAEDKLNEYARAGFQVTHVTHNQYLIAWTLEREEPPKEPYR